jgi:hypothetical protein
MLLPFIMLIWKIWGHLFSLPLSHAGYTNLAKFSIIWRIRLSPNLQFEQVPTEKLTKLNTKIQIPNFGRTPNFWTLRARHCSTSAPSPHPTAWHSVHPPVASTLPPHSPETSHGVLLWGGEGCCYFYLSVARGTRLVAVLYAAMHLFICYPTVHDTLLSLLAFNK